MVTNFGNRAQLKIQEMSFMLLALAFFFVLVFLFYIAFQYTNLQKTATNLAEKQALTSLAKVAEMPELTCGTLCIDSDKLMILKKLPEYRKLLGFSSLSVRAIYPRNDVECTDKTYPNCGYYNIFTKNVDERQLSTFVSLCRQEIINNLEIKKCEIAKLAIGVEVQND